MSHEGEIFLRPDETQNFNQTISLDNEFKSGLEDLRKKAEKSGNEESGALFRYGDCIQMQYLGGLQKDLGFTPIHEINLRGGFTSQGIREDVQSFVAKARTQLGREKAKYVGNYLCLLPDSVFVTLRFGIEDLSSLSVIFGSSENFTGTTHTHRIQKIGSDLSSLPSLVDIGNFLTLDASNGNVMTIVSGGSVSLTAKTSKTPGRIDYESLKYFYPELLVDLGEIKPKDHECNLRNWANRLKLIVFTGQLTSGIFQRHA